MKTSKQYGFKLTMNKEYLITLTIQLLVLYYALYLNWNFVTLITLFLIQAAIISFYQLIEINLKARSEGSLLRGIFHGLFYFGHFTLIHLFILILFFYFEQDIAQTYNLAEGIFTRELAIATVGILISSTISFLYNSIAEKRYLTKTYSYLHINQYSNHFIFFSFLLVMIVNIIEPGQELMDFNLTNPGLIIAFFITKLLFDFVVSCVRFYPNSAETNRRVHGY